MEEVIKFRVRSRPFSEYKNIRTFNGPTYNYAEFVVEMTPIIIIKQYAGEIIIQGLLDCLGRGLHSRSAF